MDGFTIECGPDSWVTEKPWAEQLARDLGLADELLGSNDHARRTYIARDASLTPLPEAMRMMVPADLNTVLASPLFTEAAKQAYMAEPSRAAQLREDALANRTADSDESVAAFVRRHFGDEVVETVAGPLLAGVFGGDIERLSARALLGPFVAMESRLRIAHRWPATAQPRIRSARLHHAGERSQHACSRSPQNSAAGLSATLQPRAEARYSAWRMGCGNRQWR